MQFVDRFRLGPTFRLLHEHQIRDGDRQSGRLHGPRPHRPDAGADPDAPAEGRGARPAARAASTRNIFVPMTELQREVSHREHGDRRPHRAEVAALSFPVRGGPAAADDRHAAHAHVLRQQLSRRSAHDQGTKADEAVDAARRDASRRPGTKAVVFSQWLRHARIAACGASRSAGWEHVLFHGGVPSRQAQGSGRPIPRGSEMPGVPVHRCGRRRAEPATCVGRAEHGPAVEPGGAGAAHRPRASARARRSRCASSTSWRRGPSRKACWRC